MKVKLLKKLRKQYDWYFNKDGFPVLINHWEKSVTIYDVEYLCERTNYKVEDLPTLIKIPLTEWALRFVKVDILSQYGWSIQRIKYRKSVLNLKLLKKLS